MKKQLLSLLALLISYSFCQAQIQSFPLSKLNTAILRQEVSSPVIGQSMTGKTMKIAGQEYNDGISVHAPFSGSLYLGGNGIKFVADVGVDDKANRNLTVTGIEAITASDGTQIFFQLSENGSKTFVGIGQTLKKIEPGSVVFTLLADGKNIWTSGVMKQGDKAKHIEVNLKGIQSISFSVADAGDGISGDVANWANACVTVKQGATPKFVADNYSLNPESAGNIINKQLVASLKKLPVYVSKVSNVDWLIARPIERAQVFRSGENEIVFSNGLMSRTFYISSNLATSSIKNLVTGEEYLRAIEPEANLMIDSISYPVGGLGGQFQRGYLLTKWLDYMQNLPETFVLKSFEIADLKPPITSPSKRWKTSHQWNASGKEIIFRYEHPKLKNVLVHVHYQLFDGMPLMAKFLEVTNNGTTKITVNNFESEIISYHEPMNFPAGTRGEWAKPNFYIENDYAFGGFTYQSSNQSISWKRDKDYTSQTGGSPNVVKSTPLTGPQQELAQNQQFKSFLTYVMALDQDDRERNGLSQRKMYRTLAPWATENPIFMHVTSTDPVVIKQAIDQCKATGYEMIIISFFVRFNMEDTTMANLKKFKDIADYAHSKGVEIGGYSLFSSRSINPETDVIDVKTGKPGGGKFKNAPCLGSEWGLAYLKKLEHFISYTGFDLLEQDGPYPGDFCASTNHPGHKGYVDSQWNQWKLTTDFFKGLKNKGVALNLPDFYFLSGGSKVSIGYREANWSLPREQQIIMGRLTNFDGTWTRTPSMSWTLVPLVEYKGGGKAATLEPLSEHLDTYKAHMIQNYGAGVQACYRGDRLYDTNATRDMVIAQIAHYKKYRDILNADIIHLKRPTGRDWDGIIHVDPQLKEKGYILLFNPTEIPVTRNIKVPLYYTGLKNKANISIEGKTPKVLTIDAFGNGLLNVTIPAKGSTWALVE